jgi:hypothetical protein
MTTRPYLTPGLFELRIRPHRDGTVIPIDRALWARWMVTLARRAEMQPRHALAEWDALWLIVLADRDFGRSLRQFARWAPVVEARPLRSVPAYVSAVEILRRRAHALGEHAIGLGLTGNALLRLGRIPIEPPPPAERRAASRWR